MRDARSVTQDPVCGMTVDQATAVRAECDGKTFYFCSEHCRTSSLPRYEDGYFPAPPGLVLPLLKDFIDAHNEEPRPFIWTKSADDILRAIERFCVGTLAAHDQATN